MNPNRPKESVAKGVANPRTAGTIKRLQMYRCSKVRNYERILSLIHQKKINNIIVTKM